MQGGQGGLAPQWLHDGPHLVSGEAILSDILSDENSGKPLGFRGYARTPLGELTALPQTAHRVSTKSLKVLEFSVFS